MPRRISPHVLARRSTVPVLVAWLLLVMLGGTAAAQSSSLVEMLDGLDRPAARTDSTLPPYPPTRREAVVETIHGIAVADPYRWLEDPRSSEVHAWMAAQDAYARGVLSALPERPALAARLKPLFSFDATEAPWHRQGRYFWIRKHADKEKRVVYWSQGADGEKQVLLDPNRWSDDGSVSLGDVWPSWDGGLVAYTVKRNNADEAEIRVVETATGTERADVLAGAMHAEPSWTPDGTGFYYTWVPPIGGAVTVPNRSGFAELRYHRIGTDPAQDRVIRGATGDPAKLLSGFVSKDGRWLVIAVDHGMTARDVYVKDLKAGPEAGWTTIVEGANADFDVEVWNDRLYVRTNLDAPRFRVVEIDPQRPARAAWKPIVPEDGEATITSAQVVGGHLVLTYLRKAISEVEVRGLDGALVRTMALPGKGTVERIDGLPDDDTVYITYSSFTEPSIVTRTSIKSGQTEELSRVRLPFEAERFVTEQVTYASKDGTPVTMFLIRARDATPTGRTPTILYGYGGFAESLTPKFSPMVIAWLEQGGVYAVPNLRGGGEYGEAWHRDGMLLKKQNVFDDFIAAARWLIDQRWTDPAHLAIVGRSNGGLLVGAAMTQAPELFGAVLCGVPLLDMVRYPLSGAGATWTPEYGSADDPAQFAALYAYSPYHHVKPGVKYPPLLVLSADHDDRVDPAHARKFTAAVQNAGTGPASTLLRIEKHAGHRGADRVTQAIDQTADALAFAAHLFWAAGRDHP